MDIQKMILTHLYRKRRYLDPISIKKIKGLKSAEFEKVKNVVNKLKNKNLIEIEDPTYSIDSASYNKLNLRLQITEDGINFFEKNYKEQTIRTWLSRWWKELLIFVFGPPTLFTVGTYFYNKITKPIVNETFVYEEVCRKPIFDKSDSNALTVVIANFTDTESNRIGRLLQTRFQQMTSVSQAIHIKYCKTLFSSFNTDSTKTILNKNNADLLIFGNFSPFGTFNDSSAEITYNYALKREVLSFVDNEKYLALPIVINHERDIVIGKGQENYDYILYYYLGIRFLKSHDYIASVKYLTDAKNSKNTADVNLDLIYSYAKTDDHASALVVSNEAIKNFPNNPELYMLRSAARNAGNDYRGAINDANYALAILKNPTQRDLSAIYFNLAKAHFNDKMKNEPGVRLSVTPKVDTINTFIEKMIEYGLKDVDSYEAGGIMYLDLVEPTKFVSMYKKGLIDCNCSDNLKEGLALYYYYRSLLPDMPEKKKIYSDSALFYDNRVETKYRNSDIRNKYLPSYFAENIKRMNELHISSDSIKKLMDAVMKK